MLRPLMEIITEITSILTFGGMVAVWAAIMSLPA
jgi:hypothetical protein